MDYLMPKPSLKKNSIGIIQPIAGIKEGPYFSQRYKAKIESNRAFGVRMRLGDSPNPKIIAWNTWNHKVSKK